MDVVDVQTTFPEEQEHPNFPCEHEQSHGDARLGAGSLFAGPLHSREAVSHRVGPRQLQGMGLLIPTGFAAGSLPSSSLPSQQDGALPGRGQWGPR